MNKAFTLIELLVVVLIIGILAAIALPQYQVAVAKSRLAAAIPLAKAVKDAQEIFYMANGRYAYGAEVHTLDINLPGDCHTSTETEDLFTCNSCDIDSRYGLEHNIWARIPQKIGIIMWLDQSENPGVRECLALSGNELARRVCASLGATQLSGLGTFSPGTYERYLLP